MDPGQLDSPTRKRLVAYLGDPAMPGWRLLTRLVELRLLESYPAFSSALHVLTRLDLSEERSEHLIRSLIDHRLELKALLGRDPGLPLAAIDFFCNIERLLENPAIVELSELEWTAGSVRVDGLTDLRNRRSLMEELDLEVRRCRRSGRGFAIVMLDIDGFGSVNEFYGRPFGDAVLRRVGRHLRRHARGSDAPCGIGGGRFALILPETDRPGAAALAERLRSVVEDDFRRNIFEGRMAAITVSGGIAVYPSDACDSTALVGRADRALRRARTFGSNRIVVRHEERRRSDRFRPRSPGSVTLAGFDGDALPAIRALNLGRNGALLQCVAPPKPLAKVELTLTSPSHDSVIVGRVVWARQSPAAAGENLAAIAFETPLNGESLQRHAVVPGPVPTTGGDA